MLIINGKKVLSEPKITSPDIDGGTIDNVVIGGATPAAGTFTVLSGTTVVIPDKTPVNAVASEGKLTSSGALVPATHATSEVVSDTTNVATTKTLTINATVYRFMNSPAQAYDINIGASAAETLDFLKLAINANGVGDGSDYFAGTVAHPDVVATTNTDTVQTILARIPGTTPNAYVTEETSDHLAWADATLGGGAGNSNPGVTTAQATFTINGRVYTFVDALSEDEADAIVDQVLYGGSEITALDNMKVAINAGAVAGINYSTGTVVNPDVSATTNTNTTQVVQAKTKGVSGNSITIIETLDNTVWDAGTLGIETTGVDGTVGVAEEIAQDASYIYFCVATNTIADDNWRRISIGAVY